MQLDELVVRIRRLPSAKRKKLDEILRALEERPPVSLIAGQPEAVVVVVATIRKRNADIEAAAPQSARGAA